MCRELAQHVYIYIYTSEQKTSTFAKLYHLFETMWEYPIIWIFIFHCSSVFSSSILIVSMVNPKPRGQRRYVNHLQQEKILLLPMLLLSKETDWLSTFSHVAWQPFWIKLPRKMFFRCEWLPKMIYFVFPYIMTRCT